MINGRTIVTLCGSTRFKAAFIEANFRETMAGRLVFSVGWFSHADRSRYSPTEAEKNDLDALHLAKIDASDEILVIDEPALVCPRCGCVYVESLSDPVEPCLCGRNLHDVPLVNYFGSSTRAEINHALATGKRVRYLSREKAEQAKEKA